MYIYIHIYMHVYIYTYTHIHKYIHIYIHIYKKIVFLLIMLRVFIFLRFFSVYEDKDFSISIFIIKGNARIPLHNHPKMNGLLQVKADDIYNSDLFDNFIFYNGSMLYHFYNVFINFTFLGYLWNISSKLL